MEILKIIRDSDVGSDVTAPEKFWERKASRAVVFDKENEVALVYSAKNNYHKLPGGGIEEGEDLETALRRELVEEIGCIVGDIKELGIVEEYRNKIGLHQISYCYTAHVVEKGVPQLQANEVIEEYVTKWLDLEDAIKTIESEMNIEHYDGKFMQLRDIAFLMEARK